MRRDFFCLCARAKWLGASAVLALMAACGGGSGSESQPGQISAISVSGDGTTDRIIVKPANAGVLAAYEARAAEFAAALSSEAGVRLVPLRQMQGGVHVLSLPSAMPTSDVAQIAARLRQRADVEYAEPDRILHPTAIPNDPAFNQLWHMREPEVARGGINAVDAWDITTGSPSLVMAVVDTGVLRHADLGTRLLNGYDFVSSISIGNDGNARDADARDPGDWLTASEAQQLGRTAKASSWHGTHVAGTMGASGNNSMGVAGVNWQSRILPVRALGKGGGYVSDIADGIAWASGASVPGVPANTTPARVINLSLGGSGACSRATQDAINTALSRSAVVVVAAGNENVNAASSQPANCVGVISVAAVGSNGQRAAYSNFGTSVTVAAPGGDPQRDSGVTSLGDAGTTSPHNDGSLLAMYGTSMAAPHVSGVVSLMLSVNPALTPDQVKSILQSTARAFPTGTGRDCTTSLCGAGIVNAGSAVRAAAGAGGGVVSVVPQSGIWWNPAESGRGFVIEVHDGKLYFGGYMYDASGRSTWNVSGPAEMKSATSYAGPLLTFSGGQSLTGAYRPPSGNTSEGQISIDFTSATTATLGWPGGSVPIQRFQFKSGSVPQTSFAPEAGVWWNPQESGRGYAIESQDGYLFFQAFMYDTAGNPVWYLSSGPMSANNTFTGTLVQFANGQTLTGAYKPPTVVNANAGTISMRFTDSTNASLTLPDGRVIGLQKFRLASQAPAVTMPTNQVLTAKLIGIWDVSYTIITTFTDTFLFNEVRESETTPGQYNVWGVNQYDALALGGWSPELEAYTIFAAGASFDDFYVFDMPQSNRMDGCYFLVFRSPTRLSACYPLSGIKTQDLAPLAVLPGLRAPAMDFVSRSALMAKEQTATASSGERQALSRVASARAEAPPVLARMPEVDKLIRAVDARRAQRR
jgi:serine protease